MKLLKVSLLFLIAPALSSAQSIPAIKAKALDNTEITLPNPSSKQVLILMVGLHPDLFQRIWLEESRQLLCAG